MSEAFWRKSELLQLNLNTADHYGYEAQSNQLVEECAELIQAVSKYRRAKSTAAKDKALANLIEELVDVDVMAEQIKHLLKIPEADLLAAREYKIRRTAEKIQGEES